MLDDIGNRVRTDGLRPPFNTGEQPLMTASVSLEKVTCTFASKSGEGSYTAVRDVDLAIADGEFVSVVGPTGCGKSTLLNVAAGLLKPSSGSVKIHGEPLAGINRRAGYMFQSEALMPWRSALDNVTAGLAVPRRGPEAGAREGRGLARARGPRRLRRPLPAPALRRHEEARLARADAHPRPADPAHGRALLRARRADAAAHGERAAGAVERQPQERHLHHPRPRGGDLASPTAWWCSPPAPRRAPSAST